MTMARATKLDQYALIVHLAERLGGEGRRLGKKAIQKMIHLTQELGGADAGYRFSFYTYGPYSSELAGDLDVVDRLGGVEILYNGTDNYYLIDPGKKAQQFVEKGRRFLDQNRDAIDHVVGQFGGRLAKDLELVSTIAYLRRHAPKSEFDDEAKLTDRVKALKPKYPPAEIAVAIEEVKKFLSRRR
jgi:uncharacterized protein